MATPATVNPFNTYVGLDGLPLQNGYLYFGEPFQDPEASPLTAYWDDANTQPAAQPIRTVAGYPARNGAPAQVFVAAQYSMRVKDSQGRQVFYAPNVTAVDLGGGGLDVITASAWQTVVTLTNAAYTPGSNALDVYLNGIRQISGQDYFETSGTSITMAAALTASDQIIAFARSTFGLTQAVLSDWQYDVFSGTGAQTSFTLGRAPGALANMDVSLAGVTQRAGLDFTLSGSTITFSVAPSSGTNNIFVRYGRSLPQDALRGDLASLVSALDGAGRVFINERLPYGAGTAGAWLRRTLRTYNATSFATAGLGTVASPYTGWETLFASVPSGAEVEFEDAVYSSAGGWTRTKSITLSGRGQSTVLLFTGLAGSSVPIGLGGLTFNGTPRPGYPGTVYNMGTGTVTAGQRVFTFSSVASLAVNDEVYLALGTDPNDGGQSFLRMFNRVESIVGTTVTFAIGVPEAVTSVAWGAFAFSPTFNECVKFTDGVCDHVAIRNLSIKQSTGVAFDRNLFIGRVRNVLIDGLHLPDILNGPYFGECENVRIGTIHSARTRGALFGAYGCQNFRAESISCSDLTGLGIQIESQMRQASFGAINLRGGSGKTNAAYFQAIGGSPCTIDSLTLSAITGVPNAAGLAYDSTSAVTVRDLDISSTINNVPLKNVTGAVKFGGVLYAAKTKRYRARRILQKNMAAVSLSLPAGLLRSIKGQISDATGVTLVKLNTTTTNRALIDSSNTVNFFPAAGAFGDLTTDDFIKLGTDTASYAYNADPTGHTMTVTTDGTATEGTRLVLEFEMYVPADDGVAGQIELGTKGIFNGLATLNFVAPGAVPGITTQTITVPNAAIGDRVVVSAPNVPPAGFLPPMAWVSAANTATIAWFQFSGAAADPDGAGGIYRVDLYK